MSLLWCYYIIVYSQHPDPSLQAFEKSLNFPCIFTSCRKSRAYFISRQTTILCSSLFFSLSLSLSLYLSIYLSISIYLYLSLAAIDIFRQTWQQDYSVDMIYLFLWYNFELKTSNAHTKVYLVKYEIQQTKIKLWIGFENVNKFVSQVWTFVWVFS